MRLAICVATLILFPVVSFAQAVSSEAQKQPVPGTLTPAQQAEINKALPPLEPPKLRPAVEPDKASEEDEDEEETPMEWTDRIIREVNAAASKFYDKNKTYVGFTTADLKDEIDSLKAPWGGSVTVLRGFTNRYTIRLPNVPPKLCGEIFDKYNYTEGVQFLNSCSTVKRVPLMFSFSQALFKREQKDQARKAELEAK